MKRNEKPMKERILEEALQLFSQNGYTGTSMNDIAAKIRSDKKLHCTNIIRVNRKFWDSIVEKAVEYVVPEEQQGEISNERQVSYDDIKTYTKEQFSYWTSEEFPSCFRRVLTLEQYRDPRMANLYQRYLAKGPVSYMEPIFEQLTKDSQKARQLVLDFYGPIFLLYSIYDGAEEKESVVDILDRHVDSFSQIFQQKATAVK
mgnify:CR=1 FL=1